ncbi:MAG TPA: hypothetical protein PLM56_01090 [Cyclobacteriaceae bacterium]|jgi:hypothetical protein|nr:hypothetical protein [Cytophagales bacterium]HRE67900.1 hypothetical protein [Cyclobacteriaceae bacterium]HRF32064.1 hypothetical protein [Cyclobacteriaceae bacterium]
MGIAKKVIFLLLMIGNIVTAILLWNKKSDLENTEEKYVELENMYKVKSDSLKASKADLQRFIIVSERLQTELLECQFKSR